MVRIYVGARLNCPVTLRFDEPGTSSGRSRLGFDEHAVLSDKFTVSAARISCPPHSRRDAICAVSSSQPP
uniref:ZP domain-containing protein n=1 Tax=Steinernema glaseri TaxID=37863 RepID=A0A1I8AAS6_9BILA